MGLACLEPHLINHDARDSPSAACQGVVPASSKASWQFWAVLSRFFSQASEVQSPYESGKQ